jgi:hypothetical protein
MKLGGQFHESAASFTAKTTSETGCIGGWVGFEAGMDSLETGKLDCSCRKSENGFSVF